MSTETDPEILYHYCSNDAFLKIVGGNSIWLSDLSLSNDSMEGKWAKSIFTKCCEKSDLSEKDVISLGSYFDNFAHLVGAVGFSLSEHGDTLSQWRGYANNGAGIAVGFSKPYLFTLADQQDAQHPRFVIKKVTYDESAQESLIAEIANRIISYVEAGALCFPFGGILAPISDERVSEIKNLHNKMALSFPLFLGHLYQLKNPAFLEEGEWRLVSIVVRGDSLDDLKNMQFRATHDRIIPYRTLELTKTDQPTIKRVILGPRNITPISVVEGFLAKHGHENVEVIPSTASYR
jgi:hypothetical protein